MRACLPERVRGVRLAAALTPPVSGFQGPGDPCVDRRRDYTRRKARMPDRVALFLISRGGDVTYVGLRLN